MSDLIDRQAVLDAVNNCGICIQKIVDLPQVDSVPVRHGKWLWVDGVRCSQCNYKLATTGLPSYCPNCGARMKGADDE